MSVPTTVMSAPYFFAKEVVFAAAYNIKRNTYINMMVIISNNRNTICPSCANSNQEPLRYQNEHEVSKQKIFCLFFSLSRHGLKISRKYVHIIYKQR